MNDFQCCVNFHVSLKEVSILEELAELFSENSSEVNHYKALNKTAVLLLGSKFEVFVEECIYEFVDKVNQLRIHKNRLSNYIRVKHSEQILEEIYKIYKHNQKTDRVAEQLKHLATYWDKECEPIELNINNRFSYGSHGSNEVINLFKNINIPDVFDKVQVYEECESFIGNEQVIIDFKGKLNSFINIRNNITHQDQTTNLTHLDIKKYRKLFLNFAENLCLFLKQTIVEEYECLIEEIDPEQQAHEYSPLMVGKSS